MIQTNANAVSNQATSSTSSNRLALAPVGPDGAIVRLGNNQSILCRRCSDGKVNLAILGRQLHTVSLSSESARSLSCALQLLR